MKTRYNWDEFPEWANFAATDFNGNICLSESVPELWDSDFAWWIQPCGEKSLCVKNVGETPDWKESLECRPKTRNA